MKSAYSLLIPAVLALNHSSQIKAATGRTCHVVSQSVISVIDTIPCPEVSSDSIKSTEAITLKELTVDASADFDIRGHTVIYPTVADIAASTDAISLFQKLPLPALDANPISRSLSVMGNAPVIVINGVPSSLDDFRSLSPRSILKVEYSIMRPDRYRGNGGYGYINVTLKKREEGGRVYMFGRSAMNVAFMDGSFSGSYRRGPSEICINWNPSWRNNPDVVDRRSSAYIGSDFRVNLESNDRNPFNYFTSPTNLRYIYSPKETTLFSATLNVDGGPEHRRWIGHIADSRLGEYDFINDQQGQDLTLAADLYFRRDFNSRHSIETQCVATYSRSNYDRSNRYLFSDAAEDTYEVDIDSRRLSLISEIAYTMTLNKNASLSAGVQNTISRSSNRYLSTDYRPSLQQNNNYIYASFSQQINRVYLGISSGARLYWVRNGDTRRNFIRNVSSLQTRWTISRQVSIWGAFSYRCGIPELNALTDYSQQVSPYLFSNGNPDLKSTTTYAYRLQGTWRNRILTVAGILIYNDIRDMRYTDVSYLGGGKFLSRPENLPRSNAWGCRLDLKVNNIKGFGATTSIAYTRYASHLATCDLHCNSWETTINIWYSLRNFIFSYWRKIPGKSLTGYIMTRGENGDALSVEYRPDSHWSIGAVWMYMFDHKGARYPSRDYSEVNPSVSSRYIRNSGNMILINLTYHADFGKIFQPHERRLNNSDTESPILKL